MGSSLEFSGRISEPSYKSLLPKSQIKFFSLDDIKTQRPFDHSVFWIQHNGTKLLISWWVSAKRTRSYPYARVYDTLDFQGKKVTIIPFVKDEGAEGDRDFIQWDTISLMSFLGVYVILSYYNSAKKSDVKGKITEQRHDPNYLIDRLKEVIKTDLHPHAWNITEIEKNLENVAQKSKQAYKRIESETGVKLHGQDGIDRKIVAIKRGVEAYRDQSRVLADKARRREAVTIQPKESLIADKGSLVLKNHIGGKYFWTIDEVVQVKGNTSKVFFIEKKNTNEKVLPSLNDIKDGLLKLIVYSNIDEMTDNTGKKVTAIPCLGLTSTVGKGACWNMCPNFAQKGFDCCSEIFGKPLSLNREEREVLKKVFDEGIKNKIMIFYLGSDSEKLQEKILTLTSQQT